MPLARVHHYYGGKLIIGVNNKNNGWITPGIPESESKCPTKYAAPTQIPLALTARFADSQSQWLSVGCALSDWVSSFSLAWPQLELRELGTDPQGGSVTVSGMLEHTLALLNPSRDGLNLSI